MKNICRSILVCLSPLAINNAQATVLTFDDLGVGTEVCGNNTDCGAIPDGYRGFNWSNMNYVNGSNHFPDTGYLNGVVSGDYVLYNSFESIGVVSTADFTFNGAYFTAAWRDGLTIHAVGSKQGTTLFTQDITVNTDAPNFFNFNFAGIDSLALSSFGGSPHPGLIGSASQFVMDNFTVSDVTTVPVPASIWFLGGGLLGLVGWKRRGNI